MPVIVSGTQITFNDATVQTTAGQPGTVTSVATGNGLQGGTITTSGTLSIACPTHNTVGSYAQVAGTNPSAPATFTFGTNYSAGTSAGQIVAASFLVGAGATTVNNQLSGTWKWMGATISVVPDNSYPTAIACRVS